MRCTSICCGLGRGLQPQMELWQGMSMQNELSAKLLSQLNHAHHRAMGTTESRSPSWHFICVLKIDSSCLVVVIACNDKSEGSQCMSYAAVGANDRWFN